MASEITGKFAYTAPMVNRVVHDPKSSSKNYKGNACDLRLDEFALKSFDFIRDDERFSELELKLRSHAENQKTS